VIEPEFAFQNYRRPSCCDHRFLRSSRIDPTAAALTSAMVNVVGSGVDGGPPGGPVGPVPVVGGGGGEPIIVGGEIGPVCGGAIASAAAAAHSAAAATTRNFIEGRASVFGNQVQGLASHRDTVKL
jgi:hypothetical protein